MMKTEKVARPSLVAALAGAGLLLAACGQGDPATMSSEQGLIDNEAGALNSPPDGTLSGGPAGQTPAYGEPGGAPSEAYSSPGSQPAVSEMPPPP
ncbi:MAG: hypothetical protein Q7V15_10635 [Phenylobacterium sp.]|uniref:hypothetical protein n=1 Tax=Phenylobacterium sp. TaxID=1871053 RepID=UPI00271DBC94|nr:hypothetical protein [Phenylobacterium sp.]MDO8901801.1 hypothetical protein [Phenylobacterium sp.]